MKNRNIILITILVTIITYLFIFLFTLFISTSGDSIDNVELGLLSYDIWRMLTSICIGLSFLITFFSLLIIKEIRKLNNNKE